jgi:nickel transport protein
VIDLGCRVGLGLLGAIAFSEGVMAHGVSINAQMTFGVEVQASYDEGQPLALAQVQVFSPTNAETALFTGQTDKEGRYQFIPTGSGNWEILVRQSGHGESLTVPIDLGGEPLPSLASSGSDNLSQRLITLGSVIWGCIGTALYFKGRSA